MTTGSQDVLDTLFFDILAFPPEELSMNSTGEFDGVGFEPSSFSTPGAKRPDRIGGAIYTSVMRPICFLSDFGLADDFVGTCKGVIFGISPESRIMDLTHQVSGFAVEAGAEILAHATRYMPEDTVYLAVVDPGVGTERREVALATACGALMVGPDNGLLAPAAEALGGVSSAVELTDDRFHVKPVSSTFHGRDVFAPVAAYLASGVDLSDLGEAISPDSLARVSIVEDEFHHGEVVAASVMDIDRFGNARLSVREENARLSYGEELTLDVGDGDMRIRYVETFGAAKAGELILVPDSHWRLSIAISKGNAAQALALSVGCKVSLKRSLRRTP